MEKVRELLPDMEIWDHYSCKKIMINYKTEHFHFFYLQYFIKHEDIIDCCGYAYLKSDIISDVQK